MGKERWSSTNAFINSVEIIPSSFEIVSRNSRLSGSKKSKIMLTKAHCRKTGGGARRVMSLSLPLVSGKEIPSGHSFRYAALPAVFELFSILFF